MRKEDYRRSFPPHPFCNGNPPRLLGSRGLCGLRVAKKLGIVSGTPTFRSRLRRLEADPSRGTLLLVGLVGDDDDDDDGDE